MIPDLSRTDRIMGWLACKAIELLRVSDAEFDALCADGSVSPKMENLVRNYRIVRKYERTTGGAR